MDIEQKRQRLFGLLGTQSIDEPQAGGLLGPATMNPNLEKQGRISRALMTTPISVMDERYPAWKKSQDQADQFLIASDFALALAPLASSAFRGGILSNLAAPSPINTASRRQAGMINTLHGRIPENGTDAKKLAEMLERAGDRAGYRVYSERSKISPSEYVTWSKGDAADDVMKFRVSDHKDFHREAGRISIDPTAESPTFEQAVLAARARGFDTALATRFENSMAKASAKSQAEKLAMEVAANEQRIAYVNKLPVYNGGRLGTLKDHYELYTDPSMPGFRVHKALVPAEIKTNPNRQVLVDYLLQKAQTPR